MRPVFQRKTKYAKQISQNYGNQLKKVSIISCLLPYSQKYIWSQMKTPESTVFYQIITKEHHVTGKILKAALNEKITNK